jgi:hypothetical protein
MVTTVGDSDNKKINISLCIVLFFIFMFLLYKNTVRDIEDSKNLGTILCHKEVKLPHINTIDKLIIESVIEDYWKKRSMNKSNCYIIWDDIKHGFVRGALGGAIIGGSISGAASGAIVFGSISGLFKAYNLTYSQQKYLMDYKHT